jgi:hypothetical protein
MRRLWRTALVCACSALALAGAAAPRSGDVTDQTWRWANASGGGVIVRASFSGPITRIQISAACAGGGYGEATVDTPITVASDGSFAYDGPDETVHESRLTIRGRFGEGLTGTYAYRVQLAGGECIVPTTSFTAECVECEEEPPPAPDLRFSPTGRDRTLVPFKQLGRASLGEASAAVRAKYPKREYLGKNTVRGESLLFFGFFDAEGEQIGPRVRVFASTRGRVWLVDAYTEDLSDKTSWVRTAKGVGIGSTLAELRRAIPSIRCGDRLRTNDCGYDQGSKKTRRSTDFAFDRSPGAAGARVISVSLTGWGIRYS